MGYFPNAVGGRAVRSAAAAMRAGYNDVHAY